MIETNTSNVVKKLFYIDKRGKHAVLYICANFNEFGRKNQYSMLGSFVTGVQVLVTARLLQGGQIPVTKEESGQIFPLLRSDCSN